MTEQTGSFGEMTEEQFHAARDRAAKRYRDRSDLAALAVTSMRLTSRQVRMCMCATADLADSEAADVYVWALEEVRDREAQAVADAVGECYGADASYLPRVFPGEHEGCSPEARIVSWEAGEPWPTTWPETDAAKRLAARFGVWFEPVASYALAVLPVAYSFEGSR